MNYIDILVIIFLISYGIYGYFKGFLKTALELLFLFLSIFLAFILNNKFADLLNSFLAVPSAVLKVSSFLLLFFIFGIAFNFLDIYIYSRIPEKAKKSDYNKFFGIFPAVLKGIILAAVVLTLLVAMPFSSNFKENILSSKIGKPLVSIVSETEKKVGFLAGEALNETFTLLTIKPESKESIDLGFKTNNVKVDPESEIRMLDLVNYERSKRGLKILTLDTQAREVARAHSKDMFVKGYFSHDNLEGKSPFDRMSEGGVIFLTAGENLALAPTVELAHHGLMDSPGHRANILNFRFGRIGVGVQDGGIYGKMFTQNFAD